MDNTTPTVSYHLTPSARGYKGRGYASGPAGVFRIPEMAKVGDVDGMRAVIEDIAKSMPDYWQTTMGRVYLRLAAINGVIKDKLGIVRYLCGERGVPALADDPEAYALACSIRLLGDDEDHHFLPLKTAVACGRTEIGLYLLGLVPATEELGRRLAYEGNLLHYVVESGAIPLAEALVQRGVDFDLRNDAGLTPLVYAIRWSKLAFVRFLLAQYEARGQKTQDVLRGLMDRPVLGKDGAPLFLIFSVITHPRNPALSDEDKRAMLAFLVQEGGINIWVNMRSNFNSVRKPLHLPLHAAACEANQPVLDFFLTECGMPVDTPNEWHHTILHLLANDDRTEKELLPIVTWLVEEKGADVTVLNGAGYPAAQVAYDTGKMRMYKYLKRQMKLQIARKAKENKDEEEKKKKAEAATMARRIREAEEAMAALYLELEEEEAAEKQAKSAAGKKKKQGKASGGKKKKTK